MGFEGGLQRLSEILDWLYVIGFFALIGAGIVGGGILFYRFTIIQDQSTLDFQTRLDAANVTWQDAFRNLSSQFTIYNATFTEQEPYADAVNVTDFIVLCQKWNRTSILYEPFEHRYVGFLGLVSDYSGRFWFLFDDNGVEVQARFEVKP
jgi:hypothetical protein